ncbi:MAG: ArgR family transcriptional regulator [Acutalibacteraceae bacterium]|nr:ArgR family transcriptional regulator [Acutalibacteraceae bacterium]
MKNKRQEVIIDLIQNNLLTTQDELQEALENLGFKVTQSTVSRDIKELRIVKAQDRSGVYRYIIAGKNNETTRDRNHFEEMFSKSCIDVVYSMNTVVIKCYAGMASSACVALEQLFSDLILGSLAGDDTIFAITAGEQDSVLLVQKIKKFI